MPESRSQTALRAVVTGGGAGIGRAVVKAALESGGSVAFCDIDAEAGNEVEAEYRNIGDVRFTKADVSDEQDVRRFMDEACTFLGGINLVVSNAGVMIRKPVTELSLEEWNTVIGTNLTGAFLMAKHAAPHMSAGSAMVLISSTRAFMSEPHTESYASSKGGIAALTHALAVSLGPKIRVNAVSPGWIDVTPWQKSSIRSPESIRDVDRDQHPVGRVGKPEDIARAVLYLAEPGNDFLTGANIVIDGGMTVKMIYEE